MKRGWCPTLHAPMPSGDGLLVRVKPPHARLTPAQGTALAEAAAAHGNGTVELTQRGNLQIRGLTQATTTPFAAAMANAGLANPDPAQESRRHVIPPMLLGEDPTLAPNAASFTATLEAAFQSDERLANIPAKFAIAIEAGGLFAHHPIAADLVASTNGALRPANRATTPPPVGRLSYNDGVAAYACAPPFAQLDAETLHILATLAAHHGTTLCITPWRSILLARIPAHITPVIPAILITDPNDPRLHVTACPGAPACASATIPTRTDALRLRPTTPVHISGCSKGCAHPGPAPWTLVGNNGRYDVVRNGRAGDPPIATGLTFPEAMALTA